MRPIDAMGSVLSDEGCVYGVLWGGRGCMVCPIEAPLGAVGLLGAGIETHRCYEANAGCLWGAVGLGGGSMG